MCAEVPMGATFSDWFHDSLIEEDRTGGTPKPKPSPPALPVEASTAYITATCCVAFAHGFGGVKWSPALLVGLASAGLGWAFSAAIEAKKIFGDGPVRSVDNIRWTSFTTGMLAFFGFLMTRKLSFIGSLAVGIAGTVIGGIVTATRLAI